MQITINNTFVNCTSLEAFSQLLDEIDVLIDAEVWLISRNGPLICLLKSETNMFLIYMHHNGDQSLTSVGEATRDGTFHVTLANGQLDEYPLSWCLEPEFAYKGLSYFFVNDGELSPYIQWEKS